MEKHNKNVKITTTLDGELLKKLFAGGLSNLKQHKTEVDGLNVFPVPDGDTGTNMSMTLEGGDGAVRESGFESISDYMKAFSRGTLLGARGNSGVILSQFIKGFTNGVDGIYAVTVSEFANAFQMGVQKAYEAVLNPTEGTMLTVMKDGSEALKNHGGESFEQALKELNRTMHASLKRTPELLPVLKEAGVIDSGGAGFVYFFEGAEKTLNGETIENAEGENGNAQFGTADFSAFTADSELEFGYCTEFILRLQNAKVDPASFDKKMIVEYLEKEGDSIVAVQDEDLIKIHVHTFRPGEILNFCQQFGEFLTLKIENMSVQHNEIMAEQKQTKKETIRKRIAIVAALSGTGIQECFSGIGVDWIVEGGQTDNPSAEDFVEAFRRIEAETILVLPCNSNIVMTAEQAAKMIPDADIRVIGAKSVAEGYAALSMMNLSLSADEVVRDMEKAIKETDTGLVTTATRDVRYETLQVKKGHFIGLNGEQVLSDSADRMEAVERLLGSIEGIREKAIIVVFYGKNVPQRETEQLGQILETSYPFLEYGFIAGKQDVYDYIFAIE